MNKKMIAAMGKQHGDCLRVSNQWAYADIERWEKWQMPTVFVVRGDMPTKEFKLASQALSYVLEQLAEFEKGAVR